MDEMLSGELLDRSVVTTDGTTIGSLTDVTIDQRSGELLALVVESRREAIPDTITCERTDRGTVHIPIGEVDSIRDHIVIGRRKDRPTA
ncbi:PRC-barrel domain-containing protein [Natrononativus amylolyticus]|uniref:PRC-barrel domain-containing protein n=1 Tax=Natrononativus amylolyticus TaxID=2963434 RepID=UPI0020CDA1B7|nr:PRC-barrel domain-containing protein [Natrononativus amylolyticus]